MTQWIGARFGGDRAAAQHTATERVARALDVADRSHWPEDEEHAFAALAPLVAQISGSRRLARARTGEASFS